MVPGGYENALTFSCEYQQRPKTDVLTIKEVLSCYKPTYRVLLTKEQCYHKVVFVLVVSEIIYNSTTMEVGLKL